MEEHLIGLQQLLEKKEWTVEDRRWLLEYLENTESGELREMMYEKFRIAVAEQPLTPVESNDILGHIHESIGENDTVTKASVITFWHRGIAAAVITGLCIVATYMLVRKGTTNDLTALTARQAPSGGAHLKNDVAPGGNKAVLTLADGSMITLDDMQNGMLVRQGKTNVLKSAGKLDYKSDQKNTGERLYNTISTPRGGQYQVVLPDGSHVWLNAASSLRFPTSFNGVERRVAITGEAYFEVTKKTGMPFIVTVNNSEVKVLGTHFNIMAYNEEDLVKTTLLEGSVQFTNGADHIMMKPGQQTLLVKSGEVKVVNDINTDEVVAWKNGMFHFERTDLETTMRQIARWYDVEVVYRNNKFTDKFIAEIPRDSNLSDALKALELTGKVRFDVEGKRVIVR